MSTLTWYQITKALDELKEGEKRAVDPIIQFLGDSSSYTEDMKAKAWKYLKRVPLTERQKEKLRNIALRNVHTHMGREFFPMCRFICGHTDQEFRSLIHELTQSEDSAVKRRATLLAAYFEGLSQGEHFRRQSWAAWFDKQMESTS